MTAVSSARWRALQGLLFEDQTANVALGDMCTYSPGGLLVYAIKGNFDGPASVQLYYSPTADVSLAQVYVGAQTGSYIVQKSWAAGYFFPVISGAGASMSITGYLKSEDRGLRLSVQG